MGEPDSRSRASNSRTDRPRRSTPGRWRSGTDRTLDREQIASRSSGLSDQRGGGWGENHASESQCIVQLGDRSAYRFVYQVLDPGARRGHRYEEHIRYVRASVASSSEPRMSLPVGCHRAQSLQFGSPRGACGHLCQGLPSSPGVSVPSGAPVGSVSVSTSSASTSSPATPLFPRTGSRL